MTTAPGLSPNGKQIAWGARPAGNDDVHVMNADGSGQTRITTTDPAFDGFPDWRQGQ